MTELYWPLEVKLFDVSWTHFTVVFYVKKSFCKHIFSTIWRRPFNSFDFFLAHDVKLFDVTSATLPFCNQWVQEGLICMNSTKSQRVTNDDLNTFWTLYLTLFHVTPATLQCRNQRVEKHLYAFFRTNIERITLNDRNVWHLAERTSPLFSALKSPVLHVFSKASGGSSFMTSTPFNLWRSN